MSEAIESESVEKFVPDVGRYENLPEAVYHDQWDACNATRLKNLKRTPAYCKHEMDNPSPPTPSLIFGRAFHCLVLQPDLFDAQFAQNPPCPAGQNPKGWPNTKKCKELKAQIEFSGRTILTDVQWDSCHRMHESLMGSPSKALDMLMAASAAEVSYVADDPVTGVRCKARTDLEIESAGIVADLKMTASASRSSFSLSIEKFGYDLRHAFYEDLLNEARPGVFDHHVLLAVEGSPPFEKRVFELVPSAVEKGRREKIRLMALYAQCEASGVWPGYEDKVEAIDVPEWSYVQEEREE